jgi:O-antigen/teichoic acid export membrane protein
MSSEPDDPHVRRLARSGSLSAASSAIGAGATIGTVAAVTNLVPQSTAGVFFVGMSIFLIAVAVVSLGIDAGVVRTVAGSMAQDRPDRARAAVRSASRVTLATTLGVAALTLVLVGPLSRTADDRLGSTSSAEGFIVLIALVMPFAAVSITHQAACRGFRTMRASTLVDMVRILLQLALVVAVCLGTPTALEVMAAWCLPWVVSGVVSVVAYRTLARRNGVLHAPLEPAVVSDVRRELWGFTLPRIPTRVAQTTVQRADIIIVAALLGPGEAALYTAATRVVALGQFATTAIPQAMQAVLSHLLATDNTESAQRVYQRTATWTMALSWPLYAAVAFAPVLYLTVFGSDYATSTEAIAVSVLLSVTLIVCSGAGPLDVALLMGGRSDLSLFNIVLSLVIDIGLCFALIPRIGILGAGIAWSVSLLAKNLVAYVQADRILGLRAHLADARWVAAAVLSTVGLTALVGTVLQPPFLAWAALVAVGGAAYVGLLWRYGEKFGFNRQHLRGNA